MTRHQIEIVMGKLFRVWEGSNNVNADEVLEDVCNTIGYELLKLNAEGRRAFLEGSKRKGGR